MHPPVGTVMPKGCVHLLVNAPVDGEVHIKCFPQYCAVAMMKWNLQYMVSMH